MKKKFIAFVACAVSSILACAFLPACAEEIDVENQAIIGNWLCTDIPTEGMTSDQAAAFENYYMYLNVSAYDVLMLDADDCEVETSYVITYEGEEYDALYWAGYYYFYINETDYYCISEMYADVEVTDCLLYYYDKSIYETYPTYTVVYEGNTWYGVEKIDDKYKIHPSRYVTESECDSITEEDYYYFVYASKSYYDYYPVYDANGEIESYKIYNEITDSTKEENITLRIDAYVTSEYYKDSSTTFTTLTINKDNSKYSADETLYLRFNAGTEESYMFEMDGDNKLTMTSSTSIYSFTFNRTETSYTSFCANYDYSPLHIRNEAIVGSWIYYISTHYILFIEIGASDKDTLYIKSAVVSEISTSQGSHYELTGEYTGTIEIDKSNSSYSVSGLYLNPNYGSASDYSITVMNDGSIFVESTVTIESFSHSFASVKISYDRFIELYD